jgi:hypothetical protein
MKVQAKTTIKIVQDEEIKTIFIENKIYNAYKEKNISWAFFVIDELGKTDIYNTDSFNKNFKIIKF